MSVAGRREPFDPLDFEERLSVWGAYFRWREDRGQAFSIEGNWRSPQPWDEPPLAEWMDFEVEDAELIESAVCALDMYNHVLLKCWYVRKRSEDSCLAAARRMCAEKRRRREDFILILGTAKALLAAELDRPAVVRKQRASEYVRRILGLDPLTPIPIV